jgi:hypothetical protein
MSLWRRRTTWNSSSGMTGLTTLHYWDTGTTPQADMDAASVRENTMWSTLKGYMNNTVNYSASGTVDVLDITSGDIIDVQNVTAAGGVGGVVAEPLPWHTQALVRFRTGLYVEGRQLQGKLFLPGLTETENSFGVISAAAVSGITAAVNLLHTNSALAVYSRKYATAGQVSSVVVPNRWAILSTRRP